MYQNKCSKEVKTMNRVILHCDLNNFFASVECVYNPKLKEVPMAVCGCVEDRHGIVLAKNELAKRYNIKTAEAVWEAKKKCPELVTVQPHFERYIDFSHRAREIYGRYTDAVEPFGIDECWLDVTGSRLLFGDGEEIAEKIRKSIKDELEVTISVGVSFNKIFAKLGSDMKKPDAVTVISRENFRDKVWSLKAGEMVGIGRATQRKLRSMGIITLGDVAASDSGILSAALGKNGEWIWKCASGLDISPVVPSSQSPAAKSIGRSVTCTKDIENDEDIKRIFLSLSEKISASMRRNEVLASLVQISIKDSCLHYEEHQKQLRQPTRLSSTLADTGMDLFREYWKWEKPVRAIGIRACSLSGDKSAFQMSLYYNQIKIEKMEHLENNIDKLRERYGRDSVIRASLMKNSLLDFKYGSDKENGFNFCK